ncbi:PilZ domain-containing protein [Desulfonatronovibrio hydrogenovorans]|uniref:PilZ domain-containing protein n=1 Tax=Desulfonatronovibrio hydrogenovorans TaxID=53245 RepID=UPI00048EE35F|nr:PilZ domain-containing protein [Desulfonatronovibrio hydrogenovorans]
MSSQERNYSRVETRIKAYARRTPFANAKPIFTGCFACDMEEQSTKNLYGSHVPRELIAFFQRMDEKLNMILSLLSQGNIQDDFPISAEVIEISGAGLQFISDESFEVGDTLEMALILSQFPLKVVGVVGNIHRRVKVKNIPVWVVSFTSIRDIDREKIVQFVFQEQREQIRGKRSEADK